MQQQAAAQSQSAMPLPSSALALIVLLLLSMASCARPCSDQEKSSLLRFISGLSWDGGLATSSWRNNNGTAADCCSWEGITCGGGDRGGQWSPRPRSPCPGEDSRGPSRQPSVTSPACAASTSPTTRSPASCHWSDS